MRQNWFIRVVLRKFRKPNWAGCGVYSPTTDWDSFLPVKDYGSLSAPGSILLFLSGSGVPYLSGLFILPDHNNLAHACERRQPVPGLPPAPLPAVQRENRMLDWGETGLLSLGCGNSGNGTGLLRGSFPDR